MQDTDKSREQLMEELQDLRAQLSRAEESQQILQAIMNCAPDVIIVADGQPDFAVRMMSSYGQALTGRSKEKAEGLQAEEYIKALRISTADETDRPKLENLPIYRAIKYGKVTESEEWALERPNGRRVPLLCKASPIRNAEGDVIGGITVWRDITALKEAEKVDKDYGSYLEYLVVTRTAELTQAREDAEQRETELAATINSINNGVMIFDKDGDLLRVNDMAVDLLGFAVEEEMLPFSEWIKGVRATTTEGEVLATEDFPVARAFRGETVRCWKLWLDTEPGGRKRCFRISAAPIRVQEDELIGVICTFADITEQQEQEDAGRAASLQLEARVGELESELAETKEKLESIAAEREALAKETAELKDRIDEYTEKAAVSSRGLLRRLFRKD